MTKQIFADCDGSWIDLLEQDLTKNDNPGYLDIDVMNDPGAVVRVFPNKIGIKFSDEEEFREFFVDALGLMRKIVTCKLFCFDFKERWRRKLLFELDNIHSDRGRHSIRIKILDTDNDNYRVEVGRMSLLNAFKYFYKRRSLDELS